MSDDQDESQKTEDPTQKRIEDAVKKGQVVFSREVVSFFMFLALALIVAWVGPTMVRDAHHEFTPFLEHPDSIPLDEGNLGQLLFDLAIGFLRLLLLPFLVVIVAIIGGSMIQKPLTISAEPMKPQWSRLSPGEGFKRMVSRRALTEFVKGLLKIGIVGAIIYSVLMKQSQTLHVLTDTSPLRLLGILDDAAMRIITSACVAMFFIAMADYLYQRFEYMKNLRMSKQDLKDEYKQQEGDPHVKQRIRSLRRERAKKRMMAEVPKADVVVTNPTHYAVALRYDPASMDAPRVVAKGFDNVALRIRAVAEENKVPVMRNPPLARALYDSVEIDAPIKLEHYKAVAEVIGYVYRLKGKTMGKPGTKPGPKMKK